jgi:lipopolysaccharide biosynthesis glycosyltransferase
MELISIYSLTNHSQKKLANFLRGKNQLLCEKLRILLAKINSKEIDKLEKLNREIGHDLKNEKVAVLVENIQITEIL